jgi:hypothetical protein
MKRLSIPISALLLAMLACNLPGGQNQSQGTALTEAAQTVAAQLTSTAQAPGGATPTVTPTLAPNQPTSTATPTLTATTQPGTPTVTLTTQPCNLGSFVKDVTIPDESKIMVGQAFTKTWRFKNVGTCTWTSGYQVVFDHGDQMGGPVSQPLTNGSVPPGATVDFSLNLTAPTTAGSYAGFWRFRDPSNVLFGLSTGSFWVKIKAVAPTATPTLTGIPHTPTPTATFTLPPPAIITTVAIPLVPGESGSVRSDGTVLGFPNIGDVESNASSQGFVSFDMSSIPASAHIVAVKVNFSNYDTLGNPFGNLGYMRMYPQNYGSVNAGDFFSGSPLGAVMSWANAGQLSTTAGAPLDNTLLNYLQTRVGSSRAQFRVQFNEHTTNSDGIADMVRLGNAIVLTVTWASP